MNLLSSFEQFIKTEHLFHPKDRLLLAVSGGVDSVVLCALCHAAGYDFEIAHCNFQLRGEESNGDEQFVKELAQQYGAVFLVQKFETEKYASENKLSIQVAARELRYQWFASILHSEPGVANEEGQKSSGVMNGLLLTAHHADDNIETILMNFFKGSGINGLKGILPKQSHIIRPLLFASKEAILAFAQENQLVFREDSSNSSDKYTRNYFRNQLIPGLEKVFPQVKENLLHNVERFRGIHSIYQTSIEQLKKKLMMKVGKDIQLPVLKLLQTAALSTVLYELLKDFGFTAHQTTEVQKLLASESGKYVASGTHRILRNRKWLILSALNSMEASHFLIQEKDDSIIFPMGILHLSTSEQPGKIEKDAFVAQLDARDISFPLLLRKWSTGDYFYPLGMTKKKKLSRFFIDQKYSLIEKENLWVLEANKKIIWIPGIRMDDRFKVTHSTTQTIRFVLRPSE
jgi:tRNA(Ile)-lysidine synthase